MNDAASPLIFGCMGLGGDWGDGPLEAAHVTAAHAAVDAALEAGISVFDHADIYRSGKAEAVFGRVLAERPGLRDAITLQTKCGIILGGTDRTGQYDASGAAISAAVDASLARLGVERIETLLIHRPDPLATPAGIAEAFTALRASGKIGQLGVSNMSGAQMARLQDALDAPLAANQLEMSLHHRDWLESGVLVNHPDAAANGFPHGTLEYCAGHGVELQAWAPLAQGRYSGRPPADGTPADAAAAELVSRYARELDCSPEAIVLGWLLRHPAGVRPVIGTTNPQRIAACAAAEGVAARLTRDAWYTLWVTARGAPLP